MQTDVGHCGFGLETTHTDVCNCCADVVAASFQNKSMEQPFHKLFQPASPLEDRMKAAAMNPRIDLKYFVGESHRKAGQLDEATKAAGAVSTFDPLTATAWTSLAMAEEQAGNLTGAQAHFAHAVSLFPPARLPSLLYSEFLKRHPKMGKDSGLAVRHASEKVVSPPDLIAANCDPFRLLEQ
jgi:tetratricopeptide (TPR) repeat protein